MAYASSSKKGFQEPSPRHSLEERKGLLNNSDNFDDDYFEKETGSGLYEGKLKRPDDDDPERDSAGWSRGKIVKAAVSLIVLLVLGAFARVLLVSPRPVQDHPNLLFNGDALRSNGTHDFKRTVLVVSIDGLR